MPETLAPLSNLLSIDLLPESLHLSNLTPGFLDDIQFKNHVVTNESESGHEATHDLTLVFNKTIAFVFPGSGIRLLLNPSDNGSPQTTEIDIHVYYKWNIIKFISDFNIQNVPTDFDSLIAILTGVFDIDLENILEKLISFYNEAAEALSIPVQAVVDELNRFYELTGTVNEITFTLETPSLETLESKLIAAGIELADVVTDFNLEGIVSDPNSPAEVLGAVINKHIYNLVQTLNVKYSLSGVNQIDYHPDLDFGGVVNKLTGIGLDAVALIKDLVVDIAAGFDTIKQTLFSFLNLRVTGMPTSFEDLFVPEIDAQILNVQLALEFPRSMLIPMDDQDQFLPEPHTAKLTFEVGDFTFSTQNGFDFDEVSTCELKQASVKETGITIELTNCVIDFHDDSNIPQADADGRPLTFQGVFIDEATIKLPKIWQADQTKPTTAIIKGDDLLIGEPGGFTGVMSIDTDPASPGDLLYFELPGAFKISLSSFDITLVQNNMTQSNIIGTLTIPLLTKADGSPSEIDVHVNIAEDTVAPGSGDIYTITATNFDPFVLAQVEIDIDTLVLILQQGDLQAGSEISGQLTFPVVNDGNGSDHPVPMDFEVEILENSKKIQVNNVPELKLLGIGIELEAFFIEFDDTQILNADITGTLSIPFINDPSTNQPAEITINYIINQNGFEIHATEISRFDLLGIGVDFDTIDILFDKTNGLNNLSLDGDLYLPVFAKDDGSEAPLGFVFEITEIQYKFTCSPVPSVFLFGIELKLDDFEISFTRNQLDDFELSGKLIFPVLTGDSGAPEEIEFGLSIAENNYGISASGIPTLKLLGIELTLNDIDIAFTKSGLTLLQLDGNLQIPFLTSAQDDLEFLLEITQTNYSLEVSSIPQLSLAGIQIDLDPIALNFTKSGLDHLNFGGKLAFPVVQTQNGQEAWIDFNLDYTNGKFIITASTSAIPALDLGGLAITLTSLSIAFDDTGILPLETDISGTISIPAFNVELDISIDFKENGFSIIAKVPEAIGYVDVLDIEDMINVQLSGLSIGKEGSNWSFGFAGKINNYISVPGIEKFVPKTIEIDKFDLTAQNNIDLELNMEWPNGFRINDIGAGGSVTVPVNQSFGDVLMMRAIQIDVEVSQKVDIEVTLLGTKFDLGPVNCTVEGMGLRATIEKKENGNMGPLDVDLGLIYPKGIAIGLKTDIFTGGGYLFFDNDNNRYAGAIELNFKDSFIFNAIGLLTTKLPDGTNGTSLLIIITTQFPSPIPIGYNFYLAAVGGLIGLHRTTNVDKLRQGVVTNAIDNILFPQNVISNISQIISDLSELFPPKRDQFLIGPMAMITWNNPALLTIELGLIIEIGPSPQIAILGVIKAGIPNPDNALIKLQVNFIGVIDFDPGMISFDAALFDSRIVTFTLEGSMALRLTWGNQNDFALSVGGFHPSYVAPKHLKFFEMKRLTISLLGGNPRLTLTSYFAVTTNTVQFGAQIDFYLKVWKVKVIGWFGFDVLFQFDPFMFIARVGAGLAVKWGSTTLFSISLEFTLTGPSPWFAKGYAKFKIIFVTVKARFSKTFGEEKKISLPDINVLPLVLAALDDSTNWKSEIPVNRFNLVALRPLELDQGEILMTTFGTLTISQKVVPLGIDIEKFGNSKPVGQTLFDIAEIALIGIDGDEILTGDEIREDFVPSAYKEMKDADKLTAPSFEKMRSGIMASGTNSFETRMGVNRDVEYEVHVSDFKREPDQAAEGLTYVSGITTYATLPDVLFTHYAAGGAARQSPLSRANRVRTFANAKKVNLNPEEYTVVNANNLTQLGTFNQGSKSEANEALANAIALNPSLAKTIMVVPKYKAVL